jgi:Icc-related predicted phosphoesterase
MKGLTHKDELERLSEEQQNALETELESLSKKGKSLAVNALFIVGGLALSYLLFKMVTDSEGAKSKKKNKQEENELKAEPSFLRNITQSIAAEAAIVLLAIAKDKLTEYLKKGINLQDEDASGTH